jgi:hypothetical protein
MKRNKSPNSKTFSYGYIQPTFFEDITDVVCFWKIRNRKRLQDSLIECNNMQMALEELRRIES